jgi:hypothetical protein
MQVNHGAVDLGVAEQFLDGVQMRAGFQQVSGKTVAQGVHRSGRNVEFFASQDEQALQGIMRHGAGGLAHALGESFRVVTTAADVGKQ